MKKIGWTLTLKGIALLVPAAHQIVVGAFPAAALVAALLVSIGIQLRRRGCQAA